MSKKIFITGTGTDVGKTFIAGLMIKKLNENKKKSAFYKAAMSGNERGADGNLIPGDAVFVKTISGISQPLSEMCPYVYEAAVSPHLASRIEGNPIRMDIVRQGFDALCQKYDYVTMEGSGGILCPLCFDEVKLQLEDVIKELNLSCLLIADAGLGTINSVTLGWVLPMLTAAIITVIRHKDYVMQLIKRIFRIKSGDTSKIVNQNETEELE